MRPKIILIVIVYCICLVAAYSQNSGELKQQNLRIYLSEDKNSFAGLVMVNQIWTRYSWNNPGTVDKGGNPMETSFDIGLRRSRLVLYTQLLNKVFMYTQLGYDGMSYGSARPPAVSLINAVTEYYVIKDRLEVGLGLHTWNGVSRYTNSKLMEFLVVDNPGFVYPTGNTYDQAGRQLGIYAKGTIDRFHYRVSVNKPFLYDETTLLEPGRSVSVYSEKLALKGHFDWQFMDRENHLFPYMSMNNLGAKRVLNLGAGYYFQPDATQSISWDTGDTLLNDIFILGADLFLDLPLAGKGIITSYIGYYYYDFGPGYLRSLGKMSPGTDGTFMQGPGINEWEIGTGSIVRLEGGYLFSHKDAKPGYQPFFGITYKDFDALSNPSLQYDLGANVIIYRNNIKLTFQYSSRPVYEGDFSSSVFTLADMKGVLIFQTQICF
jgi:hypothetical protein